MFWISHYGKRLVTRFPHARNMGNFFHVLYISYECMSVCSKFQLYKKFFFPQKQFFFSSALGQKANYLFDTSMCLPGSTQDIKQGEIIRHLKGKIFANERVKMGKFNFEDEQFSDQKFCPF